MFNAPYSIFNQKPPKSNLSFTVYPPKASFHITNNTDH